MRLVNKIIICLLVACLIMGGIVFLGREKILGFKGWQNDIFYTTNVKVPSLFDDIRAPLETTRINPVTSRPVYSQHIGATYAYKFAPTTEDAILLTVQIPHNYKYGTNLHPHIHWAPDSTDTGNIVWVIECVLAEEGSVFGAMFSSTSTTAAPGVVNKHTLTEWDEIDGSSIDNLSTMINCVVRRQGDDGADTFTGNAWGYEVDFHYELEDLGSTEEFVK